MKRKRRRKPLLVASMGLAAVTYLGCNEPTAIGNPKRPPDLAVEDLGAIGNPKMPPDLSVPDGSNKD